VAETWCRVWGDGKKFSRTKISQWLFFLKKFPFHAQNFWWPFFNHRPGFWDFPFLFSDFPYLYYDKCRIRPFLTRKNTISEKNSFMTPFFYSARAFARFRQHYFSKYWGGRMHGPFPTSNFGGTVPQSPPRSPPLIILQNELQKCMRVLKKTYSCEKCEKRSTVSFPLFTMFKKQGMPNKVIITFFIYKF